MSEIHLSTKQLLANRNIIYDDPEKFISKWRNYVLENDHNNLDRELLGVDNFSQIIKPIGLPNPMIDVSDKSELTAGSESVEQIKNKYEMFCKLGDKEINNWGAQKVVETILKLATTYEDSGIIDKLTAGHDKGHYLRDVINTARIYDSIKDKAASQTDLLAGIVAGLFHDTGTAITERYEDKNRAIAHAETGALKFYNLFKDDLPNSLCRAITYGIAAHTQMLDDKNVKSGYLVKPYFDEIWNSESGKLYGLCWRIPRLTDRLDCNGVSFFFRNILSKHDPKNDTGNDYSGDKFHLMVEILPQILKPIKRSSEEISKNGGVTFFEQNYNFAISNNGNKPYSKDDKIFPGYSELMNSKVEETMIILNTEPNQDLVINDELRKSTYDEFVKLSRKIMCLKPRETTYQDVFDKLESHWNEVVNLNDDYLRRWATILPKMNTIYHSWLENIANKTRSSDLQPIVDEALKELNI